MALRLFLDSDDAASKRSICLSVWDDALWPSSKLCLMFSLFVGHTFNGITPLHSLDSDPLLRLGFAVKSNFLIGIAILPSSSLVESLSGSGSSLSERLCASLLSISRHVILLSLADPRVSFIIDPSSLSLALVLDVVPNSSSVHIVVLELSNVSISSSVLLDSLTIHHSVLKLSFVSRLVWPDHDSISAHVVLFESTFVNLTSIGEVVFAMTVELSINEVTIVS